MREGEGRRRSEAEGWCQVVEEDPIAPAAVDFPRVEGRSGFDFLYGCTWVFNLDYIDELMADLFYNR